MAYEWIPAILFGILLLVVGFRIGSGGLVRLALIFAGLILIGWGIFAGWSQMTAGLFITQNII